MFPMKQLTVWSHRVSSETIACDDGTHTVFPVKHSYISNFEGSNVEYGSNVEDGFRRLLIVIRMAII